MTTTADLDGGRPAITKTAADLDGSGASPPPPSSTPRRRGWLGCLGRRCPGLIRCRRRRRAVGATDPVTACGGGGGGGDGSGGRGFFEFYYFCLPNLFFACGQYKGRFSQAVAPAVMQKERFLQTFSAMPFLQKERKISMIDPILYLGMAARWRRRSGCRCCTARRQRRRACRASPAPRRP